MRTRLCEAFDLDVPVLQAAIWPAAGPELVAAVCEAGALGSLAAVFGSADHVRDQMRAVRDRTDRPFVVNHVVPLLDEAALDATLEVPPAAVSLALGDPGAHVARIQAAGARVIHQVHTVRQAVEAADRGVDLIIAQGSEAGGQGMVAGVGAMALVPQVVDAVAPIPVLASGGIADGRGLAAALALGAEGVNVGTRFLAATEAAAEPGWKQRVIDTESEDAIRFEAWGEIFPRSPAGYDVVPRVLRTDFVTEWAARPDEARAQAETLRDAIMGSVRSGRSHEYTPFAGQSAGLVHEERPAGTIVRSMAAEAAEALARAGSLARA